MVANGQPMDSGRCGIQQLSVAPRQLQKLIHAVVAGLAAHRCGCVAFLLRVLSRYGLVSKRVVYGAGLLGYE